MQDLILSVIKLVDFWQFAIFFSLYITVCQHGRKYFDLLNKQFAINYHFSESKFFILKKSILSSEKLKLGRNFSVFFTLAAYRAKKSNWNLKIFNV
jgi:hypothetical protein